MYILLRSLTAPTKPNEKTLADLRAVLKKHYEPTTIVIAERYYFHCRNQAEGETIADYIAELRRLSSSVITWSKHSGTGWCVG